MQKESLDLDLSVNSYLQSKSLVKVFKIKIRKTKNRPASWAGPAPQCLPPAHGPYPFVQNRTNRGGRGGGGGPAELAVVSVGGRGWRWSRRRERGEGFLPVPESSPTVSGVGRRRRLRRRGSRGSGELGDSGSNRLAGWVGEHREATAVLTVVVA